MKKTTLLLLLLTWAMATLNAQKTSWRTAAKDPNGLYSFSLAPAPLAFSTLDLAVERRMSPRASLQAQGVAGWRKMQLWESLGGKYFNLGGRLEFRQYLGKQVYSRNGSLRGPYAATWVKASDAQLTATLQKKDYTLVKSKSLTPGLSVGWKFPVIRKMPNVTIDLSAGAGYRFGNVRGRYSENSRSILFKDRGFVPVFGFRIGYSPSLGGPVFRKNTGRYGQEVASAIAFHDRYSKKKRKSIEKALLKHRLDPGRTDGRFTEETIRAIKQFQRAKGLSPDGLVGRDTLRKLKI